MRTQPTVLIPTRLSSVVALALWAGVAVTMGGETSTNRYAVDPATSVMTWHGEKVGGGHHGRISLKSGSLVLTDGKLTGGEFVVDMNSIVNDDLTSKSQNQKLLNHLKSDDFFNAKKFPESRLVIENATVKSDSEYEVTGKLTIRDRTNPVKFIAWVSSKDATLKATAKVVVNRALYNVKYNSGSFFTKLGDKLINDDFTLDVELAARANQP